MTQQIELWTPQQVRERLEELKKQGKKLELPSNAYVTANFTWNEVLQTHKRDIDFPEMEILENLKIAAEVLQKYRLKIGKPIIITSSWRTQTEQEELIKKFEEERKNNPDLRKPSQTSLHLEGLALDFVVSGMDHFKVYEDFNKSFLGELEKDRIYTHMALTTYSKKYLERNGVYRDEIYKKLDLDGITLTPYEKTKIVKRINATDHLPTNFTFDENENIRDYKHFRMEIDLLNKTYFSPKKPKTLKPAIITEDKRTPTQKFEDEIRTKIRILQEENNRKLQRIFQGVKPKKEKLSDGLGHWVTINGRPVYIDCNDPFCPNWFV